MTGPSYTMQMKPPREAGEATGMASFIGAPTRPSRASCGG
jgi:hypothetical protein